MVRTKQDASQIFQENNVLIDGNESINVKMTNSPSPNKRIRNKSASAIVELNFMELEPAENELPKENEAVNDNKRGRRRTLSKKENIEVDPISLENKIKTEVINYTETSSETKLEQISVNLLTEKRSRKSVSLTPSAKSPQKKATEPILDTNSELTNDSILPKKTIKRKSIKKENKIEKKEDLSSSGSESELEIEDEEKIREELELEYNKLKSINQINLNENVCVICEMVGPLVECIGTCKKMFHPDCLGFLSENEVINFKCRECTTGQHTCIVCEDTHLDGILNADMKTGITKKCSLQKCGKYFHDECAKKSELFRQENSTSSSKVSSYVCRSHVCVTCWLDHTADLVDSHQPFKGRFVNCIRCPNTYHVGDFCVPAGSIALDCYNIICADHFEPAAKITIHHRNNVTWCFTCCKTLDLISCITCPAAYHHKCILTHNNDKNNDPGQDVVEKNNDEEKTLDLSIAEKRLDSSNNEEETKTPTEIKGIPIDEWRCLECLSGKRPLYGDIVWAKVGIYRWWPAQICHPRNLPDKLKDKPFQVGEFPVKFFGTHDFYWVSLGRCFLFAHGDEFQRQNSGKSLGAAYTNGVIDAIVAFREIIKMKKAKQAKLKNGSSKNAKYSFIFIKTCRPVGNVRINRVNLSDLAQCDCDVKSASPCGTGSCINKALKYECHPSVCPTGSRCQNQRFVKRQYPKQQPINAGDRGWGLWSLADIKKGDFVNEYVGELIDDEECKRRLKSAHENKITNFYLMTIEKDRVIDAGPKGNLARFMNHSCEPNCETQRWTVNGDVRIGLFAVVDIPAKTELTFNYNLEALSNEKAVCRCGSKNCSGFLGARPKNPESKTNVKCQISTTNSKKRTYNNRNSLNNEDLLTNPKKNKKSKRSTEINDYTVKFSRKY